MRARPVRPNIFLPVVRFGVADSDWFSVLLISCAGYLAPVPFGITVLYVPLQMWTWLLVTAGSIAFFNYIRIGRKPYWLQHKVRGLLFHHRQYRSLPNGKKQAFVRSWLIDPQLTNSTLESYRSPPGWVAARRTLLLDHHNRIQEAQEKAWDTPLLMTN